jgi:hypothetical protein
MIVAAIDDAQLAFAREVDTIQAATNSDIDHSYRRVCDRA